MRNSTRGSGSFVAVQLRSPINPPTLIEHENLRFLIADAPSNNNLSLYIQYNVTDVVRVCDPTYHIEPLLSCGIKVHDWVFGDGEAPPAQIVNDWLELVETRFKETTDIDKKPTIACHCVAGLGRAPVLVAIALIEAGMSPLDSVAFIRERRRGVINNRQLKYIESYKRRPKSAKCIIC
ncbi:9442_t:CDS:2 [Entrophospora sp. SA101]|nr:6398_t:CDS:2 [Entrophospora sp. SA101]CAJ0766178.1 9442_t:CDS:2 [Entrophospora sp. SA101]CAJ0914510.1 1582_t:CDS:2 [Entrophospora sp. SA101]CAJ0921945.1 17882_t:CDS:2 [Entrophospora sp. SA101]CAJ0921966.1 17889_t:CDS:2 [Entrophospora sp. SA101]